MTIENTESQLTAADEFAIQTATNELIQKAATRNNMRFEDVPVEAREDALRFARNAFAEKKAIEANPVYGQLQAEREAHRLTQMRLEAVSQSKINPTSNVKVGPDPIVVRAQMGEGPYRALTDDGRLRACGINPANVTQLDRSEAKRAFGKGTDTHFASNLSKQDWARYKYLKSLAIIENYQGQ
jgi:hypothetical protein